MEKLKIELSPAEQKELEKVRDTHVKAYMREKASAILQIASGKSGLEVARRGLLKARRKNTIYDWVKLYKCEGIAGFLVKSGRGRPSSFSPSKPGRSQAKV